MKRLLACLLVACGSPQPAPIENIAPDDPTGERSCEGAALSGVVVVSDRGNEPAIGATIVATFVKDKGERATISDEDGKFQLDKLERAHVNLILYYEDRMFEAPMPNRCEPITIEIDVLAKKSVPYRPQAMRIKYGR